MGFTILMHARRVKIYAEGCGSSEVTGAGPARRGPAGARRAPQALEDRRELAVGRGDHAGLAAYMRAA